MSLIRRVVTASLRPSFATVSRFALTALAAGALSLAVAPATQAQFGGKSGFAEAFKPDYLNRDMVIFTDMLGLEDWQQPIFESLLQDYNDSFNAGVNAVKDRMKAASQEGGSGNVTARVMAPIDAWVSEKARLNIEFLENVKSQLSDQQLERWPKLERAIRRDKLLHLGEISGESVDLLLLVKQLQLSRDTLRSMAPTLDAFEMSLDEALLARQTAMKAQQDQIREAMVNMDFDIGGAAIERIMATRVLIRDTQDNGATSIAAALPESSRAEFLRKWREDAYPKVYRIGSGERMFDSARRLAGLSEEQKASIGAVESSFRSSMEAIQDEMLATVRVEEPREARRKVEAMRARQSGGTPPPRDNEKLQSFTARRDVVVEEARAALEQILTPDQYAQLAIPGSPFRGVKASGAGAGPTGEPPVDRKTGQAPSFSGDDVATPAGPAVRPPGSRAAD